MSADSFAPTERTRPHRHPERGTYDREVVERTLDEALYCHVGYVVDGTPRVLPTIHVRVGETIYIHGSSASHMLRAIRDGSQVCLVATILDGLVLARSAFNHSMNYRSAVVFGPAREVTDPDEKWMAQKALVDHVCPGRSDQARMPNEKELRQTSILAIPLREASAKARTGPPKDDEEDVLLPVWAGVLPLRTVAGEPIDAPDLPPGITPPANVRLYRRPTAGS
jgi:nitroimidazol reductase NimA-like FMN-containing flavoprotein (pyridoxamine 5'-phosphate oxidase superfamily)